MSWRAQQEGTGAALQPRIPAGTDLLRLPLSIFLRADHKFLLPSLPPERSCPLRNPGRNWQAEVLGREPWTPGQSSAQEYHEERGPVGTWRGEATEIPKGCQQLHTHLATCHLAVSSWVGVELEGNGHGEPAGHLAARPAEEQGQLDASSVRSGSIFSSVSSCMLL